jgi:hypothetical protein
MVICQQSLELHIYLKYMVFVPIFKFSFPLIPADEVVIRIYFGLLDVYFHYVKLGKLYR